MVLNLNADLFVFYLLCGILPLALMKSYSYYGIISLLHTSS